MPVTEFFILQYARAYEHWLMGGDPKDTKDYVFKSDAVREAYKRRIQNHGSRALLAEGIKHKEKLNAQPVPVGPLVQEID